MKEKPALAFMDFTSFSFRKRRMGFAKYPPAPPFKNYVGLPKVKLKVPAKEGFFKLLFNRRSRREYSGYPISKEEVSALCFAAQGITSRLGDYFLRTAPSAGALYPVETYLAINFSKDIEPGLYHLELPEFSLALIRKGFFGDVISQLAIFQEFFSSASLIFLWTCVLNRTLSKYGDRGLRYIFMDVAHACQNVLLCAEEIGLKACPVGAFFDEELNEFLGVNPEEERIVYSATVGK